MLGRLFAACSLFLLLSACKAESRAPMAAPADAGPASPARPDAGPSLRLGITVVATSTSGKEREVRDGAMVKRTDRLTFSYSNPKGEHKTLAVLAWDGERVHWYYPVSAGDPPLALSAGDQARGIRLPFEIALDAESAKNVLVVAFGFDVSPADLERLVRTERATEELGERVRIIHFRVN